MNLNIVLELRTSIALHKSSIILANDDGLIDNKEMRLV